MSRIWGFAVICAVLIPGNVSSAEEVVPPLPGRYAKPSRPNSNVSKCPIFAGTSCR